MFVKRNVKTILATVFPPLSPFSFYIELCLVFEGVTHFVTPFVCVRFVDLPGVEPGYLDCKSRAMTVNKPSDSYYIPLYKTISFYNTRNPYPLPPSSSQSILHNLSVSNPQNLVWVKVVFCV